MKNWGIIIEKKDQEKIFEREFRTPLAVKKNKHGTGIGLYIVRQICKSINAQCWVEESDARNGTIFSVKLPKFIDKTKK